MAQKIRKVDPHPGPAKQGGAAEPMRCDTSRLDRLAKDVATGQGQTKQRSDELATPGNFEAAE